MVGLDGYLQRPNTCPDRAVPPDDEELSHTHTLVRVKNTTRIVPTVVTSRVHCAMGKHFSFSSRLRSIYYLCSDIHGYSDKGGKDGEWSSLDSTRTARVTLTYVYGVSEVEW